MRVEIWKDIKLMAIKAVSASMHGYWCLCHKMVLIGRLRWLNNFKISISTYSTRWIMSLARCLMWIRHHSIMSSIINQMATLLLRHHKMFYLRTTFWWHRTNRHWLITKGHRLNDRVTTISSVKMMVVHQFNSNHTCSRS